MFDSGRLWASNTLVQSMLGDWCRPVGILRRSQKEVFPFVLARRPQGSTARMANSLQLFNSSEQRRCTISVDCCRVVPLPALYPVHYIHGRNHIMKAIVLSRKIVMYFLSGIVQLCTLLFACILWRVLGLMACPAKWQGRFSWSLGNASIQMTYSDTRTYRFERRTNISRCPRHGLADRENISCLLRGV